MYTDDPKLQNSLFGAVKLVKNVDINKYKYSGYSIGFDMKGTFVFPAIGFGRNVTIFGLDMSSSAHIDNKIKSILILGESPTQGLDDTTLTAEKYIQLLLQSIIKGSVYVCIIMEQIVIYLLMVQKLLNSTQNTLKL